MLLLVVFGSSVGSVCSCWVCSFVASVSIGCLRVWSDYTLGSCVVVVVVVVRFASFERW